MFQAASLLALTSLAVVYGQQVGTLTTETHPPMTWAQCTSSGCTTQNSAVVLDSNWRWLHSVNGSTNCYTGNTWDATLCPDATTCAANCALDGGDYSGTYGITTSGNALTLKLITTASQKNVGSRVYLMAPGSTTTYQMFKPNNQEFTFDVDVSQLPCGLNGALYFVQMDSDGGMARFPTNKAGAKYGTGYCDSQCPRDIKFIDGQANSVGWTPSTNDTNAGLGNFGTCCAEMDIWEANSISSAFTPHPCTVTQQTRCTAGTDCSAAGSTAGVCDQAGCDFNAYRMGVTNFYGPGMTLDTTSKMTVTTAFHTADNTATGALTSITRTWSQNGKTIANVNSTVAGVTGNALSDSFCAAQKTAFGDTNTFSQKGGMTGMGTAQAAGVVLVMSIWDDHTANMLWLDSDYPLNKDASSPGVARGTCATTSGQPSQIENGSTNPQVTFSNIKFGPIGSTGTGTVTSPGGGTTSTGSTSTASAPSATQTKYGQCGGIGYTGPTACASGSTCKSSSPYYSQCL